MIEYLLAICLQKYSNLGIILVRDFNQLHDKTLINFPLKQMVKSSIRGLAVLDKI